MGAPDSPEWRRLLAAEQHDPAALQRSDVPTDPGVYVWRKDDLVVYVGKADSLRSRLASHRGAGTSLSGSSFRRNVAHLLFGIEPRLTGTGRQKVTPEQAAAVAAWIRGTTVAWLIFTTKDEARIFEALVRAQWLPLLNRI